MNRSDLDLLYRSLDTTLTAKERSRLDAALRGDPGLREERERLVRLRSQMERQEPLSFRPGFTGRVMDRLDRESVPGAAPVSADDATPDFENTLSVMFRRVAVAASIAAIMLLTYNLATSGSVSFTASFGMTEELYPEDLYDARMALETEGAL